MLMGAGTDGLVERWGISPTYEGTAVRPGRLCGQSGDGVLVLVGAVGLKYSGDEAFELGDV